MPSKMCAYCHAVMPSNQIERHKRKYRGDMRGTRQWRRLRQLMIDRDGGLLHGLRVDGAARGSPRRRQRWRQRPVEPDNALPGLPRRPSSDLSPKARRGIKLPGPIKSPRAAGVVGLW
jgi:hypothetical protein